MYLIHPPGASAQYPSSHNVVPLHRRGSPKHTTRPMHSVSVFDDLASKMILAQHAQGTLNPELLRYLIAGAGLPV